MRLRSSLLGIGLLTCSQPLLAQVAEADTGEVSVSGNVAPLCILGEPTPGLVDLGQLINTSGPRIGKVAALADRQVNLAGSFCNFAGSIVTVEVGALLLSENVALQPGFARAVNYSASASNWAASATTATSGAAANGASPTQSSAGAVQALPKLADIAVTLSNFTVPSDLLLVAGAYQGSVTITLGPAALSGVN
jgi:hypothetical protein